MNNERVGELVFSVNDEFVFRLENVIQCPEILECIYFSTEQALNDRIVRRELYPRKLHVGYEITVNGELRLVSKHVEAWYLRNIRGYTMQKIAEELAYFNRNGNLTDTTIVNTYARGGWLAIYREEILRGAVKIAVKDMLYPEWCIMGGRGEPDIINFEDETWIEVKCRNRLILRESIDFQITNFGYDHVRVGKPLKVVRVGYSPQRATIEIWDVSLKIEIGE